MQKSNQHIILQKLDARICHFAKNRVNHFSPTISPAPKNEANQEIESISEALAYFAKMGVQQVVIQPKYMGSYCDIYLHRNLEDTYFVSRNGHHITHIDLEVAREACQHLHQKMQTHWDAGVQLIIIQAEMMPWSALGRKLIDREFRGYAASHRLHQTFLTESSIYSKVAAVKATSEYLAFVKDVKTMSDKELRAQYPAHIIRQYQSLMDLAMLDLDIYKQDIDLYEQQLAHYGEESPLHFKAFNILKMIYANKQERINQDNYWGFQQVNEDAQVLVNLADMESSKEQAYTLYHQLVASEYEGVMLKPLACFTPNVPPAFKVRNNAYLQLIYGMNFRKDYAQYLKKRNIRSKLECSINDWNISEKMLKVPHHSIDDENYLLKLLCYKRIMQEDIERGLDPRL